MFDTLDSRALRYTDCYGQRFMKPGVYRYNVLPADSARTKEDGRFAVVVQDGSHRAMRQHSVVVRVERGAFIVEPAELTITTGDLVLWNCPESTAVPYVVVGDKSFFASHTLADESGFGHAFGASGEYWWTDAYGSGASGVVRVRDPRCRDKHDVERLQRVMAQGTLVSVVGGTVEPKEVEIVTGQSVFFAIGQSSGISITDARLLTDRSSR